MKIRTLIVDDDEVKIDLLRRFLFELGLDQEEVHSTHTAAGARMELAKLDYDLMLLDVLLPSRTGAQPSGESSMDLLTEILEGELAIAPRLIAAITSETDALNTYEDRFKRMVVQILHIDQVEDDWRYSLKCLIELAKKNKSTKPLYDVDICFQTALASPELEAVIQDLPVNWSGEEYLQTGIRYRRGKVDFAGRSFRCICSSAQQMGTVAATQLASALISAFRPRLLVMPGICGGMEGANIGDLVIADRSWDWQSGKFSDDGSFIAAPDQCAGSSDLVAIARGCDSLVRDRWASCSHERPKNAPAIKVAPMVSGSSVVANSQMHEIFKSQHRKVAAVDMECYGLYFSAAMAPEPAPKVICIKSVSDLADRFKSDDMQRFCSYISSHACLHVAVTSLSEGK